MNIQLVTLSWQIDKSSLYHFPNRELSSSLAGETCETAQMLLDCPMRVGSKLSLLSDFRYVYQRCEKMRLHEERFCTIHANYTRCEFYITVNCKILGSVRESVYARCIFRTFGLQRVV